jgi:hypothetical protein
MERFPNPTVDKLISSKELKCTFNTPALNFSTLHLDDYSFLHYTARLYENSNNYSYYIFELHDDCTMFIMNCNKGVYDEIQKYIKINDDIDIWEFSKEDNQYTHIPTSYRKEEGIGGMAIVDI